MRMQGQEAQRKIRRQNSWGGWEGWNFWEGRHSGCSNSWIVWIEWDKSEIRSENQGVSATQENRQKTHLVTNIRKSTKRRTKWAHVPDDSESGEEIIKAIRKVSAQSQRRQVKPPRRISQSSISGRMLQYFFAIPIYRNNEELFNPFITSRKYFLGHSKKTLVL